MVVKYPFDVNSSSSPYHLLRAHTFIAAGYGHSKAAPANTSRIAPHTFLLPPFAYLPQFFQYCVSNLPRSRVSCLRAHTFQIFHSPKSNPPRFCVTCFRQHAIIAADYGDSKGRPGQCISNHLPYVSTSTIFFRAHQ